MSPVALLIPLVVAQLVAATPPQETSSLLAVHAAASPRPRECRAVSGTGQGDRSTFWDVARTPALARYCRLLARGYSRLSSAPAEAHQAALDAAKEQPDRAAPDVLRGRAALALGRHGEAREALGRAQTRDPKSVADPAALHDLAVAHVLGGDRDGAAAAYRALVPRAELLGDASRQQRAYVEAGLAVAALTPPALDEAGAFLGEARRVGASPGFTPYVLSALALTLALQGRDAEAAGVAAEAGGPWVLDRHATDGNAMVVTAPGTLDAMVAVLAEATDSDLARDAWQRFLDSAGAEASWRERARERMGRLSRRARGLR